VEGAGQPLPKMGWWGAGEEKREKGDEKIIA